MGKFRVIAFWLAAIGLVSGLLFAQYMLKQQGSSLLPGKGGDFTLVADSGPISLTDFRGKVTAIYFGYLSCPDICPTSLWHLAAAINLLTGEQARQVQGVFISVDPDRDSPHALGLYARGFHDSFVGLTASQDQIDKVARQYSVIYDKVPLPDSAMGYVIDHSSVIYLVDQQGILRYFIPHNTSPQAIKDDLLELLRQGG